MRKPLRPNGKIKLKDEKKEIIFSELDSLLSSGLDFSRSFELLIEGEPDTGSRILLRKLYDSVVDGVLLWEAMRSSMSFTALDSGVVRVGEETGRLSEALDFLSSYYRKKVEQRRMVSSAIRYPVIILCTAVIVVIFMMAVIVPMFEQVYSRMGGELPGLTKWIISVSKSLPAYGSILLVIVASVAFTLYSARKNDKLRSVSSSLILKIPVAGNIVRKNNQAHFCKLLYLLTSSGIPLLSGIEMLKDIIVFYPYHNSLVMIESGLQRGELFSENMGKLPKLYDRKLVALIRVGEETNRVPQMLLRQSDELTRTLEFHLQKLGSILEPLLVLLVGALVAIILISMYMPMFKLGGIMN